jgi:outer membrane protein assembly factor BamB
MRGALRSFVVVMPLVALSSTIGVLTAGGGALLGACASDEPGGSAAPNDAGSDALLLGDVIPPEAEAELPLGEVCGDSAGLEKDAPWPMRGGCPKRGGLSSSPGPQNATLKWSLDLPVAQSSPAIAADRSIWVGTTEGDVVVLSAGGIVQAALHTGSAVRSSPARSATALTVIGSSDGALYGVDRFPTPVDAGSEAGADDAGDDGGDGGPAFRPARAVFKLPLAPIASSPAIGGDGTIYVTTTAGKLVAVAADGSAKKWDATTNDTLGSSPAIALDGTIYVGSSDRRLYAFTREGSTKWSFETGGAIVGSPVVGGDESVYVGSTDGKLYALSPDGKLRWTYATGGPISGAPAVRGGMVYVGSDDKKLHAVATTTGERKWTYETLGAVATPVIGSDGTVYVGSADGKLYAITPKGALFFAVNAKGRIHSAPAIGDDATIYVTTETSIVAIGP